MELWDGYYKDESLAGVDLIRGEGIAEGLYHLVSEVIVQHKDGTYLFMQRDFRKPNSPGLYEVTAGGAVVKGEDALTAAYRELKEETGITAQHLELLYTKYSTNTIFKGYYANVDCEKDRIRLQEGETISYQWLVPEEARKLLLSDKYAKSHRERVKEYILE